MIDGCVSESSEYMGELDAAAVFMVHRKHLESKKKKKNTESYEKVKIYKCCLANRINSKEKMQIFSVMNKCQVQI